jgi:predicted acetyltransferase
VNAEIHAPSEDDREAIARVLSTSMNFPLERALKRKSAFALDDIRCAYADGRLVATAAVHRFRQWFGGKSLPMAGVWGVATLPEHRSGGLASACTAELMDEARRRGDPVTMLYPAVVEPYRRLGYEVAGSYDTHRVALDALPSGSEPGARIEVLDVERDLDDVLACYARWVPRRTGPIEPTTSLWRDRILAGAEETFRAIAVREGGELTGFASFPREETEGPLGFGFGLACVSLIATTPGALRALLAYFRGHRGIGVWLEWVGPPNDPITLLVGAQAVETRQRWRWMLRLLDIPAALEQRGYPDIDVEATFAVDDARYPENAGPWRIELAGGQPTVGVADSLDRRPIPIGVLSSIYSGYLSPRDAVLLGHMDADDPAVEALAAMFAGPDPWCPFFF